MDVDDANLIFDLRQLNGNPHSTEVDAFWEELGTYLEEMTPAVNDRRHGEVCHMPIAISVRHLREVISQRLQQKFPEDSLAISSEELVRVQFWSRNP